MITKADLLKQFTEHEIVLLTDRSRSGAINDDVLNQAIAEASAEAESRLAPINVSAGTPSAYFKRIVGDITRFVLYKEGDPEWVKYRYEQSLKWLAQARDNPDMLGDDYTQESGGRSVTRIAMLRG